MRETNTNSTSTEDAGLPADEQDARDMARLAAGHDSALNALMERYSQKIFHYLLRSLQNEDDAADLAQETFVRVHQNRARFDTRQKFSTWLYTIASNLVRDRFRWRSRHPQVSLDATAEIPGGSIRETLVSPGATPDAALEERERADQVRKAVAALPEELRVPLILSVYEGLPHAEIGAILNCSSKAVETRLYRARNSLRESLSSMSAKNQPPTVA